MTTEHDVIVVGARCAGSPTATLLARRGYRVLLVDRATFPSDTVSTLVIHAPGVAALRRWGLLDAVRATGCPPLERYTFDFGPVVLTGTQQACEGISTGYAPRRTVLDALLVDAAAEAGAEVRTGFTLEQVLVEDGAAVGIRGHGPGGRSVTERARVVVGADGTGSAVARAVGAERYHAKPVLQVAFYTFWSGVDVDGLVTLIRGDRAIAAIPTNDGLTLVLVGCPQAQVGAFRRDVEANYLAAVDRAPELAQQIRAARRDGPIVAGGAPNFFRRPFGPGWVLVGDAGYTKDPVTAQGITDAFRGAEQCAAALDDVFQGRRSFVDAMTDYQQRRDTHALPLYELTTQLGTLEPPPPQMQQLLGAVQGNQQAMDAFVNVIAGTLSPMAFFAPANVEALLGAGV